MPDQKFAVMQGLEIDSEIIDDVFDFMDKSYDKGHKAAQIMIAMLCVVQMIQEANNDQETIH